MEIKEFCLETFLPEVRVATSNILPLPDEERTKLVGNFVGTVMKLGYGGIWEVRINKLSIHHRCNFTTTQFQLDTKNLKSLSGRNITQTIPIAFAE